MLSSSSHQRVAGVAGRSRILSVGRCSLPMVLVALLTPLLLLLLPLLPMLGLAMATIPHHARPWPITLQKQSSTPASCGKFSGHTKGLFIPLLHKALKRVLRPRTRLPWHKSPGSTDHKVWEYRQSVRLEISLAFKTRKQGFAYPVTSV